MIRLFLTVNPCAGGRAIHETRPDREDPGYNVVIIYSTPLVLMYLLLQLYNIPPADGSRWFWCPTQSHLDSPFEVV